jgi:hypothetical protein
MRTDISTDAHGLLTLLSQRTKQNYFPTWTGLHRNKKMSETLVVLKCGKSCLEHSHPSYAVPPTESNTTQIKPIRCDLYFISRYNLTVQVSCGSTSSRSHWVLPCPTKHRERYIVHGFSPPPSTWKLLEITCCFPKQKSQWSIHFSAKFNI